MAGMGQKAFAIAQKRRLCACGCGYAKCLRDGIRQPSPLRTQRSCSSERRLEVHCALSNGPAPRSQPLAGMNCAQIWRPSCLLIHQYQGAGALWAEPVPSSARAAPSISACKNFFITMAAIYPSPKAVTPKAINIAPAMRTMRSPSRSRWPPMMAANSMETSRAGATCEMGALCMAYSTST